MYKFQIKDNVAIIDYNEDKKIQIDAEYLSTFMFIKNCKYKIPKWKLDNSNLYTKNTNNNKIYLVDLIFGKKITDKIKFKDNDYLNLKKENIDFVDIYNIKSKYNIIKEISGHIKYLGKSAGQELNWGYEVLDPKEKSNESFILFHCKIDTFTKINKEYLKKIKYFKNQELTWYMTKCGYVGAHYKEDNNEKIIYLHQLVADWYGHGKGQLSVDHINQDKLDNRINNLRIVNQSTQNINTGKRKRKYNAKELPKEIKQSDLPKYVVYYKECYNKKDNKWREFFKIEKHNKLEKPWATSKSNKISITEKLEQAKNKLHKLESGILTDSDDDQIKLPKYITTKIIKNKNHLVFDRRCDNIRYNLKMVMKSDNILEELDMFKNKITKKYENYVFE